MDPIEIIEDVYASNLIAKRYLLKHSQKVADLALEIAQDCPNLVIDQEFVYEAAMLHDIGIIHTSANSIGCYGYEPYIKHGIIGYKILTEKGYSKHAQVCLTHIGTGLTKQEIIDAKLPLPILDMLPQTIEEKLVCFADKFYSKTRMHIELPKSLDKVKEDIKVYGEENYGRLLDLIKLFNYRY